MAEQRAIFGVANALALTSSGARVAQVECLLLSGHGKLILTGNLVGEARDAAQVALSLARTRARKFGIDPADFLRTDVHFHIPGGGIARKGGPSAGLAMFVALVSAMTRKPVDSTMAFTGEISLSGAVLPIDGVLKKIKAASQAGITRLFIPSDNASQAGKLPAASRKILNTVSIQSIDEAMEMIFLGK